MTVQLATTARNAMLDAITAQIGASGLLRIYNGTRPATGGTATTLLEVVTPTANPTGTAWVNCQGHTGS